MKKQPLNQAQKTSKNHQATLNATSRVGGLFVLIMLAMLTSCNSSADKNAKSKVYTSNGVGTSGTESGELYGGKLSDFKSRTSSGGNASTEIKIPGSLAIPTASISQVDVDNVPQRQVARTSISSGNGYNQTQSKTFKSSNVDNLALQQNTPKTDISSTLKARTTETSATASTGTKAKSTVAGKKVIQKGGPAKPAEPGVSLPVGDGTWVLLLMMGMYATRKMLNKSIMPSMD